MTVELRPLLPQDAEAHHAAEDEQTVRWLSGGRSTVEGVRAYFAWLAQNAAADHGKRAFGIWLDDRLAGYAEFDPGVTDGLDTGDVNIVYGVHPWARGRGVAAYAVGDLCRHLSEHDIGRAAAIRVQTENVASVRVAEKSGFGYVRSFVSVTETNERGELATMHLYRRPLA